MRSASAPLITLLNSGDFVKADLWTITLNGGAVYRWTNADKPVILDGQTFLVGPLFDRTTISDKMGLEVSTMDVRIYMDYNNVSDRIGGANFMTLIRNRGLDGATIKLQRGYMPNWNTSDPLSVTCTGAVLRFAGKVTSVPELKADTAKVTVSSWSILLNTSYPVNVYQASCMHTLYDAGCTLNPATFQLTGTVSSAPNDNQLVTGLSTTTGYLNLGNITMLTGVNAGISRTVQSNTGGTIDIVPPFPTRCSAGDTFKVYPGCDLARSTCINKFSNRSHFKGTPFVPVPETAI